jgi:hypothetical protein
MLVDALRADLPQIAGQWPGRGPGSWAMLRKTGVLASLFYHRLSYVLQLTLRLRP